jgi:peptide/nickel transport system permease protein
MPPMITLIALYTASILGGAYQVEYVFVYQGLGYDTIQAVFANDYPLLQFILVIGGIAIVIANLIADFILIKVDPRIKIA